MENRDDQILKDFFEINKKEIEDFGFSNRVMSRLPKKREKKTGWIVPVFSTIGLLISFLLVDFRALTLEILSIVSNTPIYYFTGGIMAFPIVFLIFYLIMDKKRAYL